MSFRAQQYDIIICAQCGEENFDYAPFCIGCGEPLGETWGSEEDRAVDRMPIEDAVTTVTPKRAPRSTVTLARWEPWIGAVILVLALGYAVYDWQRTSGQTDAYYRGVAAVERRDWDAAVDGFHEAGDYRDANRREEEARVFIRERNYLYYLASEAAGLRDWRGVVSALEKVEEIQPSFMDTTERLARARTFLFSEGLAGIVYLVTDGPAPGLYTRNVRGREVLLPGSDRYSSVRAISSDGTRIVYDRPGPQRVIAKPPPGQASAAQDFSSPGKSDRIPVIARLDDPYVLSTILLPGLDAQGMGVFVDRGLLWQSVRRGRDTPEYVLLIYNGRWYESIVPVSDLMAGKRIVAVDAPRSRIVLAEAVGDPRSDTRKTKLYLVDLTQRRHEPGLLQVAQGEVYSASVSRNGKWLLYITQQNSREITRTVAVLSLDGQFVGSKEPPTALTLEELSWSGVRQSGRLSASFVPSDRADIVIVSRIESGKEKLAIHNLSDGGVLVTTHLWSGPWDGAFRRDLSAFSHDGEYLASRRQQSEGGLLGVAGLSSRSRSWSSTALPIWDIQTARVQFSPRDDYVLVTVENPEGINRGTTQRIYAAHREAGNELGEARLIATPSLSYSADLPRVALPPNGSLLVYVTGGRELRAVTYEGKNDTLVAEGVQAVWSLDTNTGLSWWR